MSAENVRNHYRRQGAEEERKRVTGLLETELKKDPYNSVLRRLEAGIKQVPVKGEEQ